MAQLNFNANDVDPSVGFEPIPAGEYKLIITESEMKQTKAGDGAYLSLTMEVHGGQYAGRKLFVNLNLHNKSEQAVAIAKAELSAICRAIGIMTPKDSQELHNIPFAANVGLKKRQDTDELQNVIKKYIPRVQQQQQQNTQPTTTGNDPAPWKRG